MSAVGNAISAQRNLRCTVNFFLTYIKKECAEQSMSKPHGMYCVCCSKIFNTKGELHRHYEEEHESKKGKCSKSLYTLL